MKKSSEILEAEERGRQQERTEWQKGNRCSNCGKSNLNGSGLSDVCANCIENE